jgi:hypothetical protein
VIIIFEVLGKRTNTTTGLAVYASLGTFVTYDEASEVKDEHETIYEKILIVPNGKLPFEEMN